MLRCSKLGDPGISLGCERTFIEASAGVEIILMCRGGSRSLRGVGELENLGIFWYGKRGGLVCMYVPSFIASF